MPVFQKLKFGYVRMAHTLGRGGRALGLMAALDKRAAYSRPAHWFRSLFAVHDVDALVSLDVPWWTYKAIAAVDAFLKERPGARVFEYGSGASTIWLALRAGSVTSVEHFPGWYMRVQTLLTSHGLRDKVDLRLVPPDAHPACDPLYRTSKSGEGYATFLGYTSEIDTVGGQFDLIVIDGRARQACLVYAQKHLALGGIIVFDNSHRTRYRDAIRNSGLYVRRERGMTPCLPYPDETTLLRTSAQADD